MNVLSQIILMAPKKYRNISLISWNQSISYTKYLCEVQQEDSLNHLIGFDRLPIDKL